MNSNDNSSSSNNMSTDIVVPTSTTQSLSKESTTTTSTTATATSPPSTSSAVDDSSMNRNNTNSGGGGKTPEEESRLLLENSSKKRDNNDGGENSSTGMKACTVQLFDIGVNKTCSNNSEAQKRECTEHEDVVGEPHSKKAKAALMEPSQRLAEISARLTVTSKKVEEGGGGNGRVTISPARPKEGDHRSGPQGSVTITKLSTGTSQCVESKDLKSLIGNALESGEKSSSAHVKKSPNSYSVEMHRKQQQQKSKMQHHQQLLQQQQSGDDANICCPKCDMDFSTKEALKLHTCNSILDQHFLTDAGARNATSATTATTTTTTTSSTSPTLSSLSGNSSRSNSPPEQQQVVPGMSALQKEEVKLIKDDKDSLMIEGRPKLSISKVNHVKTTEVKLGNNESGKKIKLKIPPSSSSSSSPDPFDSDKISNDSAVFPPSTSPSQTTSYGTKLKIKLPPTSCNNGNGINNKSAEKSTTSVPPVFPSPTSASQSLGDNCKTGVASNPSLPPPPCTKTDNGEAATGNPAPPSGPGFPYSFAGKRTYSPSRVEPNTVAPGKGQFSANTFGYLNH